MRRRKPRSFTSFPASPLNRWKTRPGNILIVKMSLIPLRLYGSDGSGNTHKVKAVLTFAGVPFTFHTIDLTSAEQKSEAFLKLNPRGQAPILIDPNCKELNEASDKAFADPAVVEKYGPQPGLCIYDSAAIMLYVLLKYPGGPLLQASETTPEIAAEIAGWLSYSANEISNSLLYVRTHVLVKWDIPMTLEAAMTKSKGVLTFLDKALEGKEWLVAGKATIADIGCWPYVAAAEAAGKGELKLAEWGNVKRWVENVKKLPGFPVFVGA